MAKKSASLFIDDKAFLDGMIETMNQTSKDPFYSGNLFSGKMGSDAIRPAIQHDSGYVGEDQEPTGIDAEIASDAKHYPTTDELMFSGNLFEGDVASDLKGHRPPFLLADYIREPISKKRIKKIVNEDVLSPTDSVIAGSPTENWHTGEMLFSGNLFHGKVGSDCEKNPPAFTIAEPQHEGVVSQLPYHLLKNKG